MPIGGAESSREAHYGVQRYPGDGLILRSRAKRRAVWRLLTCAMQSTRRRSEAAIKWPVFDW